MPFTSKTSPFTHQAECLEKTWDRPAFGIFWEQGTGKSWLALNTIRRLAEAGKIDAALIQAPNSVAPNWLHDEIPKHFDCNRPWRALLWDTKRAGNKGFQAELREALAFDGLLIVIMSYEGIMTERRKGAARGLMKGKEFAKKLLTTSRVAYILDESARIKSPDAKRTKRILAAGHYAAYRRVMTGTPVANSPFDVWSQLQFVDPEIWRPHGCATFGAFKTYFGIWQEHTRNDNGRQFKVLVDYRNLDLLHDIVDKHASRLLKSDVLDLPPKLYQKRHFDMAPAQRKAYETLRDEFMIEFENGDVLSAPLAIQRMTRFQQITAGYVPTDSGDIRRMDPNPRIKLLEEVLGDIPGQVIVWAKMREDVDQIMALLGGDAVRFDGSTSQPDRQAAKEQFQAGQVRYFVSNPACAAEGLTLTAASAVVYYNVSYKLTERLQSEDRAHRIGQNSTVTYIDLIATNSIDEQIVAALRRKDDLAAQVTGDKLKDWI